MTTEGGPHAWSLCLGVLVLSLLFSSRLVWDCALSPPPPRCAAPGKGNRELSRDQLYVFVSPPLAATPGVLCLLVGGGGRCEPSQCCQNFISSSL